MRHFRRIFVLGPLSALVTVPSFLVAADAAAVTANSTSRLASLFEGMGGTIMTAMMNISFVGITILWAVLNWAVLTLYGMIGHYLIPIWDFSNSGAFLGAAEANWQDPHLASAIQIVGVSPLISSMMWSCIPFIAGFAIVLMAGLATQAVTTAALRGEDGLRGFSGLFTAVGLLVAFPLLYSAPIILGNQLGRDFYASTLGPDGVITKAEEKHADEDSGFGRTLLGNSFFTANNVELQTRDPKTNQALTQADSTPKDTDALGNVVNDVYAATLSGDWRSVLDTARRTMVGVGTAVQAVNGPALKDTAGQVTNSFMTSARLMIETFASRIVQIVLSIMGLIGLFMLLILKGSQVLAIALNFFLAPLACALYASPSTRPVFWGWVKAHVTVCLWSFLWALLLVVINVVSLAGDSLQGMAPGAGTGFHFAPIGAFLMPFILFAGIKKFNTVSQLADSLAMTSAMAAGVAASTAQGFKDTWRDSVPTGVSDVAGNKMPAGVSSWMQKNGSSFTKAASAKLSAVSSGLNAFAPGLGTAASAAMSIGSKVSSAAASSGAGKAITKFGGAAAKGSQKVSASVRSVNPLAMRMNMKTAPKTDKPTSSDRPSANANAGGASYGNRTPKPS